MSLRRHVEHAADLAILPENMRAAFWRILEYQAEILVAYALTDARCATLEVAAQSVELERDQRDDDPFVYDVCAAAIRALAPPTP